MENCIFCKIVAKQIPADILYEDADVVVFKDIRPAAPVHCLIVPKAHIPTLADCTLEQEALLGKMLRLAPRIATEQGCGVTDDAQGNPTGGFKTTFNVGPAGGQEVYHLHLHVMGKKAG